MVEKTIDGAPAVRNPLSGVALRNSATRRLLALLFIAMSIPILLFAGWTAYRSADRQRNDALARANQTADAVAERITAEMATQIQLVQTLGNSEALDGSDLSRFYAEALRLQQSRPLWHTIELDNASGDQLLNILRPFGDNLGATADSVSFKEAIRTGKPVISGVGPIGPVSEKRLVVIRVPVFRGGQLRFVLSVSFSSDAAIRILRQSGVPKGWVGAIVDGQGHLIARDGEEPFKPGQSIEPALRKLIDSAGKGFYQRPDSGTGVETIFRSLPDIGKWSVLLAVPKKELDAPFQRAVYALTGGILVSLIFASGFAILIAKSVQQHQDEEASRAERALLESEERGALSIQAAEIGTWSWDLKNGRWSGSARSQTLLALFLSPQRTFVTTSQFLAAVTPSDRQMVTAAVKRSLQNGETFSMEFRTAGEPGKQTWLRARGRAMPPPNDDTVSGVLLDISSEKHAETERRALFRRLGEAQEQVRARIARELHDQVGQTVTGLSLGLKVLDETIRTNLDENASNLAPNEDWRRQIAWLRGLAGEIGRDIHRASAELRPTALDDLGLERALNTLVAEWGHRCKLEVDLQIVGADIGRLRTDIETAAYRTIQEALTNVAKHASAKHVSLVVERSQQEIRIFIEDDGVGFDPNEAEAASAQGGFGRLGLRGMRERLDLIGGTLQIESALNAGTTIFIRLPNELASAGEMLS